MSLFYGYTAVNSTVSTTKEQPQPKTPGYKVIFDLNVGRATRRSDHSFPNGFYRIEDTINGVHSVMFRKSVLFSPLYSSGGVADSFLYPPPNPVSLGAAALHANLPRLMFSSVSVFIVVKRRSVKPAGKKLEVIISNNNGNHGKALGYKAGVDNKIIFGEGHPTKFFECGIPAEFIGKKTLISIHWLPGVRAGPNKSVMGVSHVRMNGGVLKGSFFTSSNDQIGKPYLDVFALIGHVEYYSDINFYGMKVVEGYLEDKQIEGICTTTMTEYGL